MKFEQSLKKLEKILNDIENKSLGIDELVKLFEDSHKLVAKCQKELNNAEKNIKLIIRKNEKIDFKDIK